MERVDGELAGGIGSFYPRKGRFHSREGSTLAIPRFEGDRGALDGRGRSVAGGK